jgi:Chaperone of endosialidase
MKTLYQSLLLALGALALAGTAYAQVPGTNDTSDGNRNTGMGLNALGGPAATNGGSDNTASGFQALSSNTTGSGNTASGSQALFHNTTGDYNTASGYLALNSNTTGLWNTASGAYALFSNNGNGNTASGFEALYFNTTGEGNTASGFQALNSNTTGNNNTAYGVSALQNTTGSNNTAEGFQAGFNLTTGSNNIDIGSVGVAGESNVIRIGTRGTQKVTVIAGIGTSQVTGSAVYVTTTGRLGVLASSERYKTAIAPMGSNTTKLEQLRPVTFHLKSDPKGALQYGLIAEEVAKVYPELVIRNESGRIDGVRYDELAPMLLNEVQQQAAAMRDLKQQVAVLSAALQKLQPKDELVAQR